MGQTINIKGIIYVCVITVMGTLSCSSIQLKHKGENNMCKVKFIPKEFRELNEFSSSLCQPNLCTPEIKIGEVNLVRVNAPKQIVFHKTENDTVHYTIPVCMYLSVTERRFYKYYNESMCMIYVRKGNDNKWYSGVLEDKYENEYPALPPNWEEVQKKEQENALRAQKYSDKELDDDYQGIAGTVTFDLLQYIDIELTAGVYEIYVRKSGLESNHAFVEIAFE